MAMERKEILLVDDKQLHHMYITGIINRVFPDVRVISAYSKREAMEMVAGKREKAQKLLNELKKRLPGKPVAEQEIIRMKMAKQRAFIERPFQAIVSDLNMEKRKSGIDLVRELRQKGVKAPFCLVSATHDLEAFRNEAVNAGADAVHFKHELMSPDNSRQILERLLSKQKH
ncbi:MAG: response regulator [Candidatus Micrarchaeota archaeon]|nr:response regulator [Candidatus Micrarchaeota archaeon]